MWQNGGFRVALRAFQKGVAKGAGPRGRGSTVAGMRRRAFASLLKCANYGN